MYIQVRSCGCQRPKFGRTRRFDILPVIVVRPNKRRWSDGLVRVVSYNRSDTHGVKGIYVRTDSGMYASKAAPIGIGVWCGPLRESTNQ